MKIIKYTALLLVVAALAAPLAAVKAENAQSWFFKPAGEGMQPIVFGGSKMPDKYGTIYLGNAEEKVIYLTFDAGYGCESLDKILSVLSDRQIRASFFILPGLIKYALPTVKRMIEDGHLVANHSYSHKNMASITDINVFKKELTDLEDYYRAETGSELAKYFRPPEGSFTEQTLSFCAELGYRPVFWSFAYADWDNGKQPDRESAKRKILENAHNGEVMLLHPNSETNAAILDEVLAELIAQGYTFRTLDEFNTPSASVTEAERELIYAGNPAKPDCIALSFDDGPHETYTDEILDILAEYGVKATFFMIGKNAKEHPDTVRRVIAEGHEVGNHTYSHKKASTLDGKQLTEEIEAAQSLFVNEFGVTPTLFRPPTGDVDTAAAKLVTDLGYTCVLWAWRVDARDWASPPAEQVVSTVKSNLRGGDILLLHDYVYGKSPTPQALRELLPYLTEKYTLVTVSELIS